MPIPNIFQDGDNVDATKVNENFNYLLGQISSQIAASAGTLDTKIAGVKTTAETALSTANGAKTKADNSVQLTGNQTVKGQKVFQNLVKAASNQTEGGVVTWDKITRGTKGGAKLGTGIVINWETVTVTGDSYTRMNFTYPFTTTGYKVFMGVRNNGDINWSPGSGSGDTHRKVGYVDVYANDRVVDVLAWGY